MNETSLAKFDTHSNLTNLSFEGNLKHLGFCDLTSLPMLEGEINTNPHLKIPKDFSDTASPLQTKSWKKKHK